MRRFAKKDDHEKEEEEAERNVRKSPKKKPPRTDKTRRRIKKDDKDTDKDPDLDGDKDLSMNYKDIGGSIEDRVLRRFLFAEEKTEPPEPSPPPEEDDGPPGPSSSEDEEEIPFEGPDQDGKEEEQEEPSEEDKEEIEKNLPSSDKEEDLSDEEVEKRARELYKKGVPALMSSENSKVRKEAVRLMKKIFPPDWNSDEAFDSGVLTLEARERLRNHVQNWDWKTFEDNLTKLKKSQLDVFLENPTDKQERYHEVVLDLLEKEKKKFSDASVDPPTEVSGFVPDSIEGEYDKETENNIQKAMEIWWDYLRMMGKPQVKSLLAQVEQQLNQEEKLSARYAALSVLKNFINGAIQMKNDKDTKISQELLRSIKKGFVKGSRYGGLPGPVEQGDRKPPVTHWKKPDPSDLRMKDYQVIIREAIDWYKSAYLTHDLREYNKEMARRAALDYAIYDARNQIYNGVVDTPKYNQLLDALKSILNE